jgi:nitrogen fixation protein NifU and related proteins
MKLEAMYQEIILDHYRRPVHQGLREPYDTEVHHVNPTCGDEVTLRVKLEPADDGNVVVKDVSYQAQGCSISQASTSVMADLVIDEPLSAALDRQVAFLDMMQARGEAEPDEDELGDAVAFVGVAQYPARVKCALLSWMAFKDAVAQTVAARDQS